MKHSHLFSATLIIIILLFSQQAFGLDIVRMQDGRVIEGKILEETGKAATKGKGRPLKAPAPSARQMGPSPSCLHNAAAPAN